MNDRKTIVVEDELQTSSSASRKTIVVDENKSSANRKTVVVDETPSASRSTIVVEDSTSKKTVVVNHPNKVGNRKTILINQNGKDEIVDTVSLQGEVLDGGYIIERLINDTSGQAVIYLVSKDNKQYVAKIYRTDATVVDPVVIKFLENCNNKNIIKIIHKGTYKNRTFVITPYYEEGAVIDHLDEIDIKLLKDHYIKQLNDALNEIHEAGIIHCDIKPNNIYFSENRKEVVIADFGIAIPTSQYDGIQTDKGIIVAGRELEKDNVTVAFLPPEGGDYKTVALDYFALGMSLLYMAHHADPYEDVSDDKVHDIIFSGKVRIPDDVDGQIGKLLEGMTKHDHLLRFGFEEVDKWVKDHNCYGKIRKSTDIKSKVEIVSAVINGLQVHSTEEYVEEVTRDFQAGVNYFVKKNGLLNDLGNAPGNNKDFIHEVYDIKKEYSKRKQEAMGFTLCLLKLYPVEYYKYYDLQFKNFKDYIAYVNREIKKHVNVRKNYSLSAMPKEYAKKIDEIMMDKAIIYQQLKNEMSHTKNDKIKNVISIIDEIYANYEEENAREMIRNYFTDDKSIIIDGNYFENYLDLSDVLFDQDLTPLTERKIFNPTFFKMLLGRDDNLKTHEKEFMKLLDETNATKRNAKLCLLLTNTVKFYAFETKICSLYDFNNYVKKAFEYQDDQNKKAIAYKWIAKFIRSGKLSTYYSLFPNTDKETTNLIHKFSNSKEEDVSLVTYYYNYTQENARFIFKDINISNVSQLIDYLAKTKNLSSISKDLIDSNQLKAWLEGQGLIEE